MTITKLAFWKATAERALKTAAEFALVFVGADAVNAFEIDFVHVAGLAAGGAIVSVLFSISSIRVGGFGPSVTKTEQIEE